MKHRYTVSTIAEPRHPNHATAESPEKAARRFFRSHEMVKEREEFTARGTVLTVFGMLGIKVYVETVAKG